MNDVLLIVLPLVYALAFTEAIELLVALLFGMRSSDELWAVGYVNLITNPILNYILLFCAKFHVMNIGWGGVVLLEIIIVIAEWLLMFYALKKRPVKLFFLSLVMNSCSVGLGLMLLK